MEQLPKIVRERLQANRAVDHPDADLLAAFVERSLAERERTQVLEHLCRCHECRGVVSLTTPEPTVPSKPQPTLPVSGWLRWPMLRWGTLAACVVVVSAVGLLYRERSSRTQLQPMTNERTIAATELQEQSEAVKPVRPSPKEMPETRTERSDSRAPAGRNQALAAPQAANQAEHQDTVTKSAPAPPPAVQAPENRLAVNIESNRFLDVPTPLEKLEAAPSVASQGALAGGGTISAAKPTPSDMARKDEGARSDQAVVEVDAMAPEMPAQEVKSAKRKAEEGSAQKLPKQVDSDVTETQTAFATERLASTAASTNAGSLLRDLKSTRWSLSDDGLPQRSSDAGNTWEKVEVDHTSGFRALSGKGLEVWVGGRNGVLYHSTDLGLHWARVTPIIEGAALSADIIRIEFVDSLHGKLTTAENQTLVTSDGGKSWQKQ